MAVEISDALRQRVAAAFPSDGQAVAEILARQCGDNLPFCQGPKYQELVERVRLAVVQLSRGDVGRFLRFVASAQQDWRDVLAALEG